MVRHGGMTLPSIRGLGWSQRFARFVAAGLIVVLPTTHASRAEVARRCRRAPLTASAALVTPAPDAGLRRRCPNGFPRGTPAVRPTPCSRATPCTRSRSAWPAADRGQTVAVAEQILDLNLGRVMTDGQRFTNAAYIEPGWVLALPAGVTPAVADASPASETVHDARCRTRRDAVVDRRRGVGCADSMARDLGAQPGRGHGRWLGARRTRPDHAGMAARPPDLERDRRRRSGDGATDHGPTDRRRAGDRTSDHGPTDRRRSGRPHRRSRTHRSPPHRSRFLRWPGTRRGRRRPSGPPAPRRQRPRLPRGLRRPPPIEPPPTVVRSAHGDDRWPSDVRARARRDAVGRVAHAGRACTAFDGSARPARRGSGPDADATLLTTERALRTIGADERLLRVDIAIRAAASQLSDRDRRILAVMVDDQGAVEIVLSAPCPTDEPFSSTGDRWHLAATTTTESLGPAARPVGAPCVGLVQLGVTPDSRDLYVDLEALSVLAVDAAADRADAVVTAIAATLGTSVLAEVAQLVGVGLDPATFVGHRHHVGCDSFDAAFDLATSLLGSTALATRVDVRAAFADGRRRGVGTGDPARGVRLRGRSRRHTPRRVVPGLAVVVAGSLDGARHTLVDRGSTGGSNRWGSTSYPSASMATN